MCVSGRSHVALEVAGRLFVCGPQRANTGLGPLENYGGHPPTSGGRSLPVWSDVFRVCGRGQAVMAPSCQAQPQKRNFPVNSKTLMVSLRLLGLEKQSPELMC